MQQKTRQRAIALLSIIHIAGMAFCADSRRHLTQGGIPPWAVKDACLTLEDYGCSALLIPCSVLFQSGQTTAQRSGQVCHSNRPSSRCRLSMHSSRLIFPSGTSLDRSRALLPLSRHSSNSLRSNSSSNLRSSSKLLSSNNRTQTLTTL